MNKETDFNKIETTIYQEWTLRDVLKVLVRGWGILFLTLLISLASVFIGLKLKTPEYTASVKMLVSAKKQVGAYYYQELVDFRKVEIALTQSEIVMSNPVFERTVRALKLNERPEDYEHEFASKIKIYADKYYKNIKTFFKTSYEYFFKPSDTKIKFTPEILKKIEFLKAVATLKSNVTVKPIRDTDLFLIQVKDYNPVAAYKIANVLSRSYVIFDLEQQMADLMVKFGKKNQAVQQMENQLNTICNNLNGDKLSSNVEAIGPATVKIIDQAEIPLEPNGKKKSILYGISLMFGFLFGILLIFIFEYLDQNIKDPQEIERFLNIKCLGSIPKRHLVIPAIVVKENKNSQFDLAYNSIADQIYRLSKKQNIKNLLLCPSGSRGKRYAEIAANLSISLSFKASVKVLLIDANFRTCDMKKIFNIKNEYGFSDILLNKAELDTTVFKYSENLSILHAGKSVQNPTALFSSVPMENFINKIKETYDLVLLYVSDITRYKDAHLLSLFFHESILILEEGKNHRQAVKSAISVFEDGSNHFEGAILFNRTYILPSLLYKRI